jgi:hypothetical protein
MSAGRIITTLWEASRDKLTGEQLEALCCGEEIAYNLSSLASIMNGTAALIANDHAAGNLQGKEDVSTMLWGFAWAVAAAGEAVKVATEAQGFRELRAAGLLKGPAA